MSKPRKPVLKGWSITSIEGGGVMHNSSGRFWFGAKNLRAIGKFFIKAADYIEAREKT